MLDADCRCRLFPLLTPSHRPTSRCRTCRVAQRSRRLMRLLTPWHNHRRLEQGRLSTCCIRRLPTRWKEPLESGCIGCNVSDSHRHGGTAARKQYTMASAWPRLCGDGPRASFAGRAGWRRRWITTGEAQLGVAACPAVEAATGSGASWPCRWKIRDWFFLVSSLTSVLHRCYSISCPLCDHCIARRRRR